MRAPSARSNDETTTQYGTSYSMSTAKSPLTLSKMFEPRSSVFTFEPTQYETKSRNKFSMGEAQQLQSLKREIKVLDFEGVPLPHSAERPSGVFGCRLPSWLVALAVLMLGAMIGIGVGFGATAASSGEDQPKVISNCSTPTDTFAPTATPSKFPTLSTSFPTRAPTKFPTVSETSAPTSTVFDDTCGSEALDAEIRTKIANFLEDFYASSSKEPVIRDLILDCLPNDAFGAVSTKVSTILKTKQDLKFFGNALTEIKEGAFDNAILGQLEVLTIANNGITSLPTRLLDPLPKLLTIDVTANALSKIDNAVFSNHPRLEEVILDINSGLVELPQDLQNLATMTLLTCSSCFSLASISEGFFSNLRNLETIELFDSRINEIFSLQEFISLAGIDTSITEVLGF